MGKILKGWIPFFSFISKFYSQFAEFLKRTSAFIHLKKEFEAMRFGREEKSQLCSVKDKIEPAVKA